MRVIDEVLPQLVQFITVKNCDDIAQILMNEKASSSFTLRLSFIDLLAMFPAAAECLMFKPRDTLLKLSSRMTQIQKDFLEGNSAMTNGVASVKSNVRVTIGALPMLPDVVLPIVPSCRYLWTLVGFHGTIVNTGNVSIVEYTRWYECIKCKERFSLDIDLCNSGEPWRIGKCSNADCESIKFVQLKSDQHVDCYRNCQEVYVQESEGAIGRIPKSIAVLLLDDLVDTCKVGDEIVVTGVVERRWSALRPDKAVDVQLFISAMDVQLLNKGISAFAVTEQTLGVFEDFWEQYAAAPLAGRDKILHNICPQVYGLYYVKLALALVLAGGAPSANGADGRCDCHMLLVGDPGVSKSQFLQFAYNLIPHSVYTTGTNSSASGLTVTAVRDGPNWNLEPGALVTADGGVCCIDEFGDISEHDKTTIHEAMEQQSISVAKAGRVCRLNTRCTVLAAMNSRGELDADKTLAQNTGLSAPLLSRFDLILVLSDGPDAQWDEMMTSAVVGRLTGAADGDAGEPRWPPELLRGYFAHIRKQRPPLDDRCSAILRSYYLLQRAADNAAAGRATVRLLQSLVRLAQAHAKLMWHPAVTEIDALVAIDIMEKSLRSLSALDNSIRAPFPDDPDQVFVDTQRQIFSMLQIHV